MPYPKFPTWLLVIFILSTLHLTPAQAALSAEQIQKYKDGVGRIRWREAANHMARLRVAPPNSTAARVWKELDDGIDIANGRNPLARATAADSPSDLELKAAWLRGQVLSNRVDGRYGYAYALNLSRLGNPGDHQMETAIFLAHARLSLQIDLERCENKMSAMDIMLGYESQPGIRALDKAIRLLSPRQQATAALEAVILEETLGERPPLPWLCNVPSKELPLTEIETPPGDIGRTFVIGKQPITPKFIDESEWRESRRKRLQQLTSSLLSDL